MKGWCLFINEIPNFRRIFRCTCVRVYVSFFIMNVFNRYFPPFLTFLNFSVSDFGVLIEQYFYSKRCADADWSSFHSLLCTGERSKVSSKEALLQFIKHANGKAFLPFSFVALKFKTPRQIPLLVSSPGAFLIN